MFQLYEYAKNIYMYILEIIDFKLSSVNIHYSVPDLLFRHESLNIQVFAR